LDAGKRGDEQSALEMHTGNYPVLQLLHDTTASAWPCCKWAGSTHCKIGRRQTSAGGFFAKRMTSPFRLRDKWICKV